MERAKPLFKEKNLESFNIIDTDHSNIKDPDKEVQKAIRNLNRKNKIIDNLNRLLDDINLM